MLAARPIKWPLFVTTFKESKMFSQSISSISSSENEEIKARPSKLRGKDFKQCYMHVKSIKKEKTKYFTCLRWDTFRNRAKRWLSLQGENLKIAETYKHCLEVELDDAPEDTGFHSTCYRRFIDIYGKERYFLLLVRKMNT